jgi:hypothetical protein
MPEEETRLCLQVPRISCGAGGDSGVELRAPTRSRVEHHLPIIYSYKIVLSDFIHIVKESLENRMVAGSLSRPVRFPINYVRTIAM